MNAHDLYGAAWRRIADARRVVMRSGSERSALDALGNPERSDLATWIETTTARHDQYRAAHPVAEGSVAIVCVSMRPHLVGAVASNVARQAGVEPELVFVANAPDFDRDAVDRTLRTSNATVVDAPVGTSLGAALNLAMDQTDARFIAKFDDDDVYGPHHLADSLRAHRYAGAGVVGKHSYFARIADTGSTHIRFPGNEFRYSGTLAGGTLVIDRDRVDDQRFDDISLGEDRAFLARCHRRGISTFSADRFNFLQVRTGSNTWVVDDGTFLSDSVAVDESTVVDR